MSDNGSKILVFLITLSCCAFGAYLAIYLPSYVNNSEYLGGLIFLQIVAAALWNYRQRFFPVLLLVFLVAGILTPLAGAATVGRWFILAAGAIAGFVAYLADPSHRFGTFHLFAALCVVAAFVSAMFSAHPVLAALKALSILLLFLYGAGGARLAIVGREAQFLRGCLVTCEVLVYINAVLHFIFHISLFNNPNSLGALTGVALTPLLAWGVVTSHDAVTRRRRSFAFIVSVLLLFFSLARAAIVGALLSCVLLCVVLRQYRLLAKGLAVALAAAALIAAVAPLQAPPQASERDSLADVFVYKGKREAGLLGSRQTPWQQTFSVIQEHPWFGSGFGTSKTAVDEVVETRGFASNSKFTREHGSSYLAILEWQGLVGVSPFLALLMVAAVNAGKVLVSVRRTSDASFPALPMALVIIAGLVHAAFEDWMFAVGYYLCVFFWSFAFVLNDFVSRKIAVQMPHPISCLSQQWLRRLEATVPAR
ncbi:MAG TPA: O-antigen ligase family protein [Terriglobales bacterium]|nr:O-antigen ligase family protein [Terriglobales bacterium]